eukprot:TRINITY_DN6803_c0_g1_i1.p5 TRINITY_DN6803_c0_g1~~TRINITY_DN6803_c0_g1_i1.p5  ORF type:complete len:112 (-),score=2.65 TRINITY_DN6803_c0_g1_i1:536-871(-)
MTSSDNMTSSIMVPVHILIQAQPTANVVYCLHRRHDTCSYVRWTVHDEGLQNLQYRFGDSHTSNASKCFPSPSETHRPCTAQRQSNVAAQLLPTRKQRSTANRMPAIIRNS